ncbi:MAG TPA: fumarate reductase/succinate dehydrogenase flavoprotein subunit, partial [Propionibacteriaceae bacterium]
MTTTAPAKKAAVQTGDPALAFYRLGDEISDSKAPDVDIEKMWKTRQFQAKLVNPSNRRKLTVIIVGTGLAGGAAAATLGEA